MREQEAAHSGSQTEEAVRRIAELRAQGCRLYYFVPDFASDEGLWCSVFRSYLRAYSAEDQAALILMLPEGDASAELGEMLELLAALGEDAPLVLAHLYSDAFFYAALRQEDCLIAAWAMDRSILAFLASLASRTETVVKPAMGTMTVTVSVSTLPKDR